MAREFNVLALIKGEERFIFIYDEVSHDALLNAFRDQAADPRLSLTWFDAAVLTEKAREQAIAGQPQAVAESSEAAHDAHDTHDAHETTEALGQDDPDFDSRTKARF